MPWWKILIFTTRAIATFSLQINPCLTSITIIIFWISILFILQLEIDRQSILDYLKLSIAA